MVKVRHVTSMVTPQHEILGGASSPGDTVIALRILLCRGKDTIPERSYTTPAVCNLNCEPRLLMPVSPLSSQPPVHLSIGVVS